MRSIGEPHDIDHNYFDHRYLVPAQVIGMVKLLAFDYPALQDITVKFSQRLTSSRCASMWHRSQRVTFYSRGLNEKTVLHEMAHFLAGPNADHGPRFKDKMRELCAFWKQRQGATI